MNNQPLSAAKRQTPAQLASVIPDQLPPHEASVEQSILSCCMNEPDRSLDKVFERITDDRAFYDLRHQVTYRTIKALHAAGIVINLVTIITRLNEDKKMEDAGGLLFLSQICDSWSPPDELPTLIDIVLEKYALRRMAHKCAEFNLKMHEVHNGNTVDVISSVEMEAAKIAEELQTSNNTRKTSGTVAIEVVEWIEKRIATQGKLSGIGTGYHRFDDLTDGLQIHEHALIAARPSVGKSAMALDIVRRVSVDTPDPITTLIVSAEMLPAAMMKRMLSALSGVLYERIRKGTLSEGERKKLNLAMMRLQKAPIIWEDATKGIRCSAVCAKIQSAARKGAKLVVIDYLQKIRPDTKAEKRTYEVGDVSERITAVARTNNIHILSLAQLNRESEKDAGRRPRISDLADSGQIERDADVVALLHRNRFENPTHTELILAKQREGNTGIQELDFRGELMRFENKVAQHHKNAEDEGY